MFVSGASRGIGLSIAKRVDRTDRPSNRRPARR